MIQLGEGGQKGQLGKGEGEKHLLELRIGVAREKKGPERDEDDLIETQIKVVLGVQFSMEQSRGGMENTSSE